MAERDPPFFNVPMHLVRLPLFFLVVIIFRWGRLFFPCATFKDPKKWSSNFQTFLGFCLCKNPRERKSAADLIQVKQELTFSHLNRSRGSKLETSERLALSWRILSTLATIPPKSATWPTPMRNRAPVLIQIPARLPKAVRAPREKLDIQGDTPPRPRRNQLPMETM
jgi:hypothetical protein